MTELLQKLQHTDILAEEEDFRLITEDDLEASVEESQLNYYGKLLVEHEINILNIRRSLRKAWRGHDFRVCKIDFHFLETDFWVQISGLPVEWYSSRIGKKLFSCLPDCLNMNA